MNSIKKLKKQGVVFLLPKTVFIGEDCEIENGCVIGQNVCINSRCKVESNTQIQNSQIFNSKIGKNCVLYGVFLQNSTLGDNCVIINSVVKDSLVMKNNSVGPFAYLRENAKIEPNCRVGDFVEIKNSTLGEKTKSAHLCYIGDAVVGKSCNLGCGCVFANYDGKKKHKTQIGNNTFVGANVNLVAPLKVGQNCFVGAGTTINKNIDDNMFVVSKRENIQKTNNNF